jgi:hypothetical protein
VAQRIVEGAPRLDVTYSPWLTANLTLDRWPRESGLPAAWDNVIFDSPSLGYVVATHQHLRRYVPRTVWTYYWALAHDAPAAARRWLLAQDWASIRDRRARILTSATASAAWTCCASATPWYAPRRAFSAHLPGARCSGRASGSSTRTRTRAAFPCSRKRSSGVSRQRTRS